MGKDKKNKQSTYAIDTKKLNPKTGLIDAASIRDYKSVYANLQAKHGKEANPKLEEHIDTRMHKTVDEQKKKRKRDIMSVLASTGAGTLVPFSGIPIMVATTMVQCVGFSASLGLIPIANVRSFKDVNTLASQLSSSLQQASSSGAKAAIEAFVLEVLKQSGIGYWLWEEILKDIVVEITSGVVMDSAWVITPLFAAPKYYLHRKLIKKMYVALGEKAIVVHKAWVNDHLFLGKPETVKTADGESAVAAAAVMPESYPGFSSAYANGYPSTGQPAYESNSVEGVPYPVYYTPAFASSAHRASEENPLYATPHHCNSFPHLPQHPHSQYAYYPPSYSMHPPHGQPYPSSGPQHQKFHGTTPQQYPSQHGTSYNPSSQVPNHGQNPQVNHVHTNSMPHLQGPYGFSANNFSLNAPAPPVGYPAQGQNGDSGRQSVPQQGSYGGQPSNSQTPHYSQAPPVGYPLQA